MILLVPMKLRPAFALGLTSLWLSACTLSSSEQPESVPQVRRILLQSRHLGAHGMGYNTQSEEQLSRELTPSDIPALLDLVAENEIGFGAQLGLASQCEAAIIPVRETVTQGKLSFPDAEDIMGLIENSTTCASPARQQASAMRSELHSLEEAEHERLTRIKQAAAALDARIQENGLKLMDPNRAKELTRQEREEVYQRSLKAIGLKEVGPLTPAQKEWIQQMHRTMVLGNPGRVSENELQQEQGTE